MYFLLHKPFIPKIVTSLRRNLWHILHCHFHSQHPVSNLRQSALTSLLPFLKAVCCSKKLWQVRHTGIRIVQQIAIMIGGAALPHLCNLVDCIAHGLSDEQQKVRIMTALGLTALTEAAAPYGIEPFDNVLKPLWLGIRLHRGKGLAVFLKLIGFIIPLMDPEYASYYTKEVTVILIRKFQMSDEEMAPEKNIILTGAPPSSMSMVRQSYSSPTSP